MGWLCTDCRDTHETGQRCPKKVKRYGDEQDKKFMSSKAWQVKRLEIITRDNAHCQRCRILKGKMVIDNLSVHHIISRKKIYKNKRYELLLDNNNLICLCRECNTELGDDKPLDFSRN